MGGDFIREKSIVKYAADAKARLRLSDPKVQRKLVSLPMDGRGFTSLPAFELLPSLFGRWSVTDGRE